MWRYLRVIAGLLFLTACDQFREPPPTAVSVGGQSQQVEFSREGKDWGIIPIDTLRSNRVYDPTPTTVPGGKVIKTGELQALKNTEPAPLLINVLQGLTVRTIPGSTWLSGAGAGGSFNDKTQDKLAAKLKALTQGKRDRPLVFYCLSAECWGAYNATLRALKLGYTNVAWYRGGIHAWESAGAILVATEDDQWTEVK